MNSGQKRNSILVVTLWAFLILLIRSTISLEQEQVQHHIFLMTEGMCLACPVGSYVHIHVRDKYLACLHHRAGKKI